MKTDLPLTLEQIPYTFSRCFQSDCPQADTCAHFLASKFIIKGQVSGPAIYPTSRLNGTCVCYKQTGIIHAAYGFKALFAEIKKKDEKPIRDRIKKYLGGNTAYYRYHHGKRLLSPDQQEWILALFRQHGYTEELHFDGYRDIYDFI
ncbi:MAG TPA: hypothetical protein H9977_02780 [Candidatus Parabacteroides intestinipullorum]|uniref:Uncharacterized protein n=1 Tax=Candidatus Parabacteroides intestinipullorum TaxID=2838723 RepID=A0A9D1X9L1_9BACT|nr:hypothetical protein [Candidatus Parabacteroides intestinipullorum]